MTTTPPEAPSGADTPQDGGPRVTRDEVRDLGRLRRSVTDRKVAGVAGGLARHLDIDPVILRVAFVVLVFFGGAGLIVYAACWLLVPEEGSDTAPFHLDDRSRTVALAVAGILGLAALLGHSWGAFGFPWPLAVIALLAVILLTRRDAKRTPPPAYGPRGYGPPAYGPPTYGRPAYGPPTAESQTHEQAVPPAYPPAYPPTSPPTSLPGHPPAGWTVPASVPPRSPRKRGPILFWFTLALIALAEGVLGIVDLAGASVAGPAYPALAVGITGLMLLVGAFWGRAGGLILIGLVSAVALAGTTVADRWDGTTLHATPTSASHVRDSYDISNGEIVLDLTDVSSLSALDGRTVHLRGDVGHLEVIVPDGLDTTVHAKVHGPGAIRLFGQDSGGVDVTMNRQHDGGRTAPELTIDADLSVGQIEVHQ